MAVKPKQPQYCRYKKYKNILLEAVYLADSLRALSTVFPVFHSHPHICFPERHLCCEWVDGIGSRHPTHNFNSADLFTLRVQEVKKQSSGPENWYDRNLSDCHVVLPLWPDIPLFCKQ